MPPRKKGFQNRRFWRRFAHFAAAGKVGRAGARNTPPDKAAQKARGKPLRTAARDGRMETREIKTEVVRNGDQQGEAGRDQPGYARTSPKETGRSEISSRVRENEQGASRVLQSYRWKDTVKEKVSKRAAEYKTAATFDSAEEWTHKAPAYTDRNGNVHFSSEIPAEYITEALEHELNHVMKRKRYQP